MTFMSRIVEFRSKECATMESRLGRTIPSLLKTYRKPAQGKPRVL